MDLNLRLMAGVVDTGDKLWTDHGCIDNGGVVDTGDKKCQENNIKLPLSYVEPSVKNKFLM